MGKHPMSTKLQSLWLLHLTRALSSFADFYPTPCSVCFMFSVAVEGTPTLMCTTLSHWSGQNHRRKPGKELILFCFLTQWGVNCSTASHPSLPPCSPPTTLLKLNQKPIMDTWSVGPQSTSPWPLGPQQKVSSLNLLSSSTTFSHSHSLCQTSSLYLLPSRIMTSCNLPQNPCSLPGNTAMCCPHMLSKYQNHNIGN